MAALGTPVVVDFFSRYFATYFDEKNFVTTPTAGQAFFGRPENGAYTIFSPNSTDIDVDIVRGNLKTAKMIQRGMAGRVTGTTHADVQVGAGPAQRRARRTRRAGPRFGVRPGGARTLSRVNCRDHATSDGARTPAARAAPRPGAQESSPRAPARTPCRPAQARCSRFRDTRRSARP